MSLYFRVEDNNISNRDMLYKLSSIGDSNMFKLEPAFSINTGSKLYTLKAASAERFLEEVATMNNGIKYYANIHSFMKKIS